MKKLITYSFVFLFIIFSTNTFAERTLYVNQVAGMLGDHEAEDSLLSYSLAHEIDILLLYELSIVQLATDLTQAATNQILADFILKARNQFNISEIGAVGRTSSTFTDIVDPYNNSRSNATEKIDRYHLEFEFWNPQYYCASQLTPNGFPCTDVGAFDFFMEQLDTVIALADGNIHPIETETYVGWVTQPMAQELALKLDRILIHSYQADPMGSYDYTKNRLIDFATAIDPVEVSIIYSGEPLYMEGWLESHSMIAAETIYIEDYNNDGAAWQSNINITGFSYFAYNDIIDVPLSTYIVPGDEWKYYAQTNEPIGNWKDISFNDASWTTGLAQLGYGDGDENSVLSSSQRTTYFRKSFNVTDPTLYTDVDLEAVRDDGMIVYLNGVEVWRDNMPSGAVDYNTLAASSVAGGYEDEWFTKNIANSLIQGTNVIAVEIHQSSLTSTDLSFDFHLIPNLFPRETLIERDEEWNYFVAEEFPEIDWISNTYDDSFWNAGAAKLGYGRGDEVTVLPTTPVTGYFRHTFTVANPTQFVDLTLKAIRDDGIIVYLNGVEVWRDNMPSGPVTYGTFASSTVSGSDETTWFTITVPNTLLTGSNVLSAEVHQRNLTSSDLGFDFELIGNLAGSSQSIITPGSVWSYFNAANPEPPTTWWEHSFDDSSWSQGNAELGYGDGDETTLLPSSALTTYYRKSFQIADPAIYTDLICSVNGDDGYVVYLNDIEIWRKNMPSGPTNYNTLAFVAISDDQEFQWFFKHVNNILLTGTNVISVEMHQHATSSSDMSFNLDLAANLTPASGIVTSIGLVNKRELSDIFIYPNPSKGTFNLVSSTDLEFELYNSIGELILSGSSKETLQITMKDHPNGLYILSTVDNAGTQSLKKLIKID